MKSRFIVSGIMNFLTSIDIGTAIFTAIITKTIGTTFSYVFGKIVHPYFDEPLRKFRFFLDYAELVEKFGKELEKLRELEKDVRKHNRDELFTDVEEWKEKAMNEVDDGDRFLEEFKASEKAMKRRCGTIKGDWRIRLFYGKEATEKTKLLLEYQEDGKVFKIKVSNATPPPNELSIYQNMNLVNTQLLTLKEITDALNDENIQIIGIYGMGGVGKTTLAMEAATKRQHNFKTIAITTVTHKVDINKILRDTKDARTKIDNGEKDVVIILDDVWEALDLKKLCIPDGLKYKILLTCRSKDVCVEMKSQKNICVKPLRTEEAMDVFKLVVGEELESDTELGKVALNVVKECGGLPLIIQVIGRALQNKGVKEWKRALTKLRKNTPVRISRSIRKAYTHLKLSYDYLGDDKEAQWCFLMCSMFPEDEDIKLEDLVYYGVGLGKFKRLISMEDARERVKDAVNILTSACLLLKVNDKRVTKMHDVARDVALSIASEGENYFLIEAGKDLIEWMPRNTEVEVYTGISLMKNKICKLPDYRLPFKRLVIFLINKNENENPECRLVFPNEFFRAMKAVKVLNMASTCIGSLPRSLNLLKKLRMLNLTGNVNLVDITELGKLQELEILIISFTGIETIPKEIGELVNLRRLEAIGCEFQYEITPHVISKLWRLEELCIEITLGETFDDIRGLSKLTNLTLNVKSSDIIPEYFDPEKVKRFYVQIGKSLEREFLSMSKRQLVISNQSSPLKARLSRWMKKQIEVSRPHLCLDNIHNLNNIFPNLYQVGFNEVENIELKSCHQVSCLVNAPGVKTNEKFFTKLKYLTLENLTNLKVLWDCPNENISFENLVKLDIHKGVEYSTTLKRLFPVSVARGLGKLEELSITGLSGLEEVIWGETGIVDDNEVNSVIVFPSLIKISFDNLARFSWFCNESCTIKYPSLLYIEIHLCPNMRKWGSGTYETPKLKLFNYKPPPPSEPYYTLNKLVADEIYKAQQDTAIHRQHGNINNGQIQRR